MHYLINLSLKIHILYLNRMLEHHCAEWCICRLWYEKPVFTLSWFFFLLLQFASHYCWLKHQTLKKNYHFLPCYKALHLHDLVVFNLFGFFDCFFVKYRYLNWAENQNIHHPLQGLVSKHWGWCRFVSDEAEGLSYMKCAHSLLWKNACRNKVVRKDMDMERARDLKIARWQLVKWWENLHTLVYTHTCTLTPGGL